MEAYVGVKTLELTSKINIGYKVFTYVSAILGLNITSQVYAEMRIYY